ncbi:MAG: DNA photolyase family protein [Hydrotalea flava]|uniref:cryptochrome/photolyase family protein n=1 Tax=Hydrotalea sp. AMD TaxID=2501297 RepID=UPI0009426B99|nr:deoxyribodipyrimidine photo-lyase [Hydrotalea sp. AMD]MBY0348143.1 DNA photolyase family protein [Hydrotalea flava]RWZ89088.1 MAG: deoxyribodipyrimidine photo-lyase [Hydrotalea sp. AMD]
MKQEVAIMWFRRDLRFEDNAALYHAFRQPHPVIPLFIFDTHILDKLTNRNDARVQFIHSVITNMHRQLMRNGSGMWVYYGSPLQVFQQLSENFSIQSVYTNTDYEQYAIVRDAGIADFLLRQGAAFYSFKDQVIFDGSEVVKENGKPYTVFTPYSRKWKALLQPFHLKSYPSGRDIRYFFQSAEHTIPTLAEMGFHAADIPIPSQQLNEGLIAKYNQQRNFPAVNGTSRLGIHLRFGTISIRMLAAKAQQLNEVFLNELIWRDFYHSILYHFPHVRGGKAFKPIYDQIEWSNNEAAFEKWCAGKTGYPIVDAGMRELNATGYMHNRVRMIVASFLTKHLLIDWRWGEAYFAEKLLDYDFAANNGGWQWAAGSGCDAAPYFRIFNPALQTEKFDKNLAYINKWIPELNSFEYPDPIVQHEMARKRALQVYGAVLKNKKE